MIIGYVLMIAGTLCFLLFVIFLYQGILFGLSSNVAEGVITDINVRYTPNSNSRVSASNNYTYTPLVQFTANDGQSYTFMSKVGEGGRSSFQKGENVKVLYDKNNPKSAVIDSFIQRWLLEIVLFGFALVFIVIGYINMRMVRGNRHKKWLLKNGERVDTEFQKVEDGSLSSSTNKSNGINIQTTHRQGTYKIVSQWLDPTTNKVHVFRSENIWFNPEEYIKNMNISVYINPKNPNVYYVDISFLPQSA